MDHGDKGHVTKQELKEGLHKAKVCILLYLVVVSLCTRAIYVCVCTFFHAYVLTCVCLCMCAMVRALVTRFCCCAGRCTDFYVVHLCVCTCVQLKEGLYKFKTAYSYLFHNNGIDSSSNSSAEHKVKVTTTVVIISPRRRCRRIFPSLPRWTWVRSGKTRTLTSAWSTCEGGAPTRTRSAFGSS